MRKTSANATATAQQGIAPLVFLVIVGLLAVGGFLVYRGFTGTSAMPTGSTAQSAAVKQTEWETYTSKKYGYSVKIPKGWKVTDTPSETSRETTIMHPEGTVLVIITALKDEKLADTAYMKSSMQEFKQKLENDPATVQLATFKDSVEGNTGGFIAIGEEKREGLNWYFEQRGLFTTSGKALLFHGAAQSSVYKEYKDIISAIIENFRAE